LDKKLVFSELFDLFAYINETKQQIYRQNFCINKCDMTKLIQLSDEELVSLYQYGNDKAFDVLLNRHKKRLYSYILFIVKNDERAEDLFQETFIKAIMTIKQGRYTETGKFASWILCIAHNQIIDSFRQGKSESNVFSNEDDERDWLNDTNLTDTTIEDQIIANQIQEDIRTLINYLPANQQQMIHLRYYNDLSFREIAEITGISINTALGRTRYAILNLRRLVEEKHLILTID